MEPDEDGRYHEAGEPPEAAVTAARLPVPDAVAFLRGRWRVARRLADHVTGTAGTFDGAAAFTDTGPGTLDYHEQGELCFGTYRGEASRRLVYRGRPDGTVDVCFADGRDFYRLDPRPGRWQGQHPCGRDHYTLTAERLGPGTYREHWTVRGPDTDYEIITTLTRTGPDQMPT